ncbi:MAG: alpha-ketoacid dehydrogenase subunit beta [Deltaproteobacteria bacterium]|nr:alpha-ketoacid dehydrogenase subunit beta [Deltaproteobacteria bacterium]
MPLISYREALNDAMREEMQRDSNIFILGEDVGFYGGAFKITEGLFAEFGEKRVVDTPIAEGLIVGAAIGAAMVGLRPIAELMTVNFALLAMDQIVNHAAKIHYMFGGKARVPLVIRAPGGGGKQLAAQHSQSLESYFLHCPGLKLVMPSTPEDAKGLLKESIRDDGPVIFLEHEHLYNTKGEVPSEDYTIPIGKASIKRTGRDLTIISYSNMVLTALEAAEQLEKEGISVEIVDPRTLNPLDIHTILASVKKTNRVIIVEEDWKTGGVGAEIASQIYENVFASLDAPIIRVAGKDTPMPYAKNLERAAIPQFEDIMQAAINLL